MQPSGCNFICFTRDLFYLSNFSPARPGSPKITMKRKKVCRIIIPTWFWRSEEGKLKKRHRRRSRRRERGGRGEKGREIRRWEIEGRRRQSEQWIVLPQLARRWKTTTKPLNSDVSVAEIEIELKKWVHFDQWRKVEESANPCELGEFGGFGAHRVFIGCWTVNSSTPWSCQQIFLLFHFLFTSA